MTFSSAFEDAIVGGKKLSDVLKGLHQDIIRIAVRKSITEPLANMFTGFMGSLKIPGLEFGGPVKANHPYVVGEAGPELFVPSGAGEIVPMSGDTISTNTIINNHFAISSTNGNVSRETQQQIAAKVGVEVGRAMDRIR
jgi:hypothetical protein